MLRVLPLTLALLLVLPAAAQAQEGVRLIGPTATGGELRATARDGELCLEGSADERAEIDTCSPAPAALPPHDAHGLGGAGSSRASARWGIAGTGIAEAEVELAGGDRVRAPTAEVPAGLPGAGAVRVFLLTWEGERDAVRVRFFDAGGTLRRALDGVPSSPSTASEPVASGGSGPLRWRLVTRVAPRLAPTPLEPDRTEDAGCVVLHLTRELDRVCPDAGAAPALLNSLNWSCRPGGTTLTVLARPAVRGITAVLGDGSIRRLALHPLPAVFDGARAGALVVGARTAIRRLVVEGAGVGSVPLGMPPAPASCAPEQEGWTRYGGYRVDASSPAPKVGAEPPPLAAADDAARLCTGLGSDRPSDCRLPPVGVADARVHVARGRKATTVGGVVAEEIPFVELVLADGAPVRLATTTESAYAGVYAGRVRFFRAVLPRGARLLQVRLLGPGGERYGAVSGPDLPFVARAPQVVLRGPGAPPLYGASLVVRPEDSATGCVALERRVADCAAVGRGLRLQSRCDTHRFVLYGAVARGTRMVEMRLDGRRTVRVRTVAAPAFLGRSVRLVLLALPRGARPRELLLHAKGTTRIRVPLPSAGEQCGYDAPILDAGA